MKIVRRNGEPLWSKYSLLKNPSTRLRFSIWVIIANFIMGTIGMILGTDLTALGVFISLCNTPLYAYILGRSFRGAQIPDSYYNQSHCGSGGASAILGNLNNRNRNDDVDDELEQQDEVGKTQSSDSYNMPMDDKGQKKDKTSSVKSVKKDCEEIG